MNHVDVYWIGWVAHRPFPRWVTFRWIVTGRQADGQRASRAEALRVARSYLAHLGRRSGWPRRPWQAEWEGCRRAVRGWTREGTRMRAHRAMVVQAADASLLRAGADGLRWWER